VPAALIVLGIDPGTAIMGYGVIEYKGSKHLPLAYGVLRTNKEDSMADRLKYLYNGINQLIDTYQPDAITVEELFFNQNVTTALTVGQARGIVLLAAGLHNIPVTEFTPLQVKQAVVGYGRAEKQQVQYMVQRILGLKSVPKPDDAADALAIAICHCQFGGSNSWRSSKGSNQSWEEWLLKRTEDQEKDKKC